MATLANQQFHVGGQFMAQTESHILFLMLVVVLLLVATGQKFH